MAKKQKHQRGFGIIEIIIFLVVIGILAFAGWWVYQNNRTKVSDAAKDTSQSANNPSITTNPGPAVTYLDIKEWGVRLPLSAGIIDAYYSFEGSGKGDDGLPNTAWLSLKSLDSKGCNVASGPVGGATPTGSILRVLPTDEDPVQGVSYTKLYPNGVTIDGHYYVYASWLKKTCGTANYLQSVDSAFATAIKNTQQNTAE